jgi:uncharacterized protein YcbX
MRLASIHTYPVKGCHRLDHDAAQVEPWGLVGDRRWMVVDDDGVGVTQREAPALVALRAAPRPGGLVLTGPGLAALDLTEPSGGDPVEVRVFESRHRTPAIAAGPVADDWLAALLGRKARLVWLGDPTGNAAPHPAFGKPAGVVSFADGFPLLLANTASLDAVNGWLLESGSAEGPLPMTRFRPNLVVDGALPWAEAQWPGQRIRIGEVVLRAVAECARCVVSTTDQETGERGREPLRILGARRNVNQKLLFGLHLVIEAAAPATGSTPPAADEATDRGSGAGTVAVGDPVELLA